MAGAVQPGDAGKELDLYSGSGAGSELLHVGVVGLLVSLRHDGHGRAVQNGVPPSQPQQRRSVANAAEGVRALTHLACRQAPKFPNMPPHKVQRGCV